MSHHQFHTQVCLFKRIAGLLFLFVGVSCGEGKKTEQKPTFEMSDQMFKTTTMATARRGFLKNEIKFYGSITTDNNKLVEIYPIVGGNVQKVYVELGDYVEKGTLLATIRSMEVAEYERELEDAQADLLVAKSHYKTTKDLFDGKLSTEKDVITAHSTLEKAQSRLKRAQETYKIYNLKPNAIYEVRSPLSGFVIQKNINEGMLLRNDRSDNIFDIAQIDEVWAIANVNESDIDQVKLGAHAEVTTFTYPDKKFYGNVDKIYNVIDPETKTMKALIKLKNTNLLLKPDMMASIKMFYTEKRAMLCVPSSAIIFDKSKNFVMLFHDRTHIVTQEVEVFRQVHDSAYILSGLQEGDKVLTNNQLLIYDALND